MQQIIKKGFNHSITLDFEYYERNYIGKWVHRYLVRHNPIPGFNLITNNPTRYIFASSYKEAIKMFCSLFLV